MADKNQALLHVCIIGSGPAGYYAAEILAAEDHVRVDIIDKLPTPYGLIRGGVAPDHQSIKGVFRRYEKTSLGNTIHFIGNMDVGKDVTLAELRGLYDAVVVAVGAPKDRKLWIPGNDKTGVIGSAAFVGWYNSHPDFANLKLDLDVTSVAVIGNGNVAVDVARVLAKTPAEMAASDLAPYAAEVIHKSPLKDIWILGRRGPLEAKFTPKEVGEMGQLENCVALTSGADLPDLTEDQMAGLNLAVRKNIIHLQSFAMNKPDQGKKALHIKFYAMPVEILGEDKVTGIRMEKTRVDENAKCIGTGETFEIECQMVIPCIGYQSIPLDGAPFDDRGGKFVNDEGKIENGLYATGWARRGPTGTIGTNRPDGHEIAAKILKGEKPSGKEGRAGLDALIKDRKLEVVTFRDWKKIEAAEEQAATGETPRVKFHDVKDLIKATKT